MADIFVSYTSSDRDWAFWIGQQLEKLGHIPHLHDWEISAGGNIMAWMDERHDRADNVLCVVSKRYLEQPYSALERHGAQWAAASKRPNFLWPVFVEACEAPLLLAPLKHCDLHGLSEADALARLASYLQPAARPSHSVPFPGTAPALMASGSKTPIAFPGRSDALSNIPITVPRFFLGRDEVLKNLRAALADNKDRVAITTLFGLRGVGKTTLAAAYALRHRGDYLATWWIRAESDATLRADLVGLGVRLGWVAGEEKEEVAVATVMDHLRYIGEGILLIFDNAIDADSVEPYFPAVTGTHILVTSNAHAWRDIATPLRIDTWPPDIGAEYLLSRTGRGAERQAALALSNALGGLPLAHEQAAAYCERLEVALATYHERFDKAPVTILGDPRDAPRAYHNRLTAAKSFALAIEEAGKLHAAVEPLITHAAILAPEPIPLFLFADGRGSFTEPLASALAGDGLDEAVGILRAFALVDRELVPDERDPSITTDCIRLHRLVRDVAAVQHDIAVKSGMVRDLILAMWKVYPPDVMNNPAAWPRARRLDAIAVALVKDDDAIPEEAERAASGILDGLASFRQGALGAYVDARPLLERALAIDERRFGPDHPDTGASLNNLGILLRALGDFLGAQPYCERALAISERVFGPDHPRTASSLNNIGVLLDAQGDLAGARPNYERALAIREKALGPDHPETASSLNNLGYLLRKQGLLEDARPYYERSLAINEKVLGPDHPDTARSLNNLGYLLEKQGNVAAARPFYERALAIRKNALGPDHPDTARSLNNLGGLLWDQGDGLGARTYCERAVAIGERALGPDHPDTKLYAQNLLMVLEKSGLTVEAETLRKKFKLKDN